MPNGNAPDPELLHPDSGNRSSNRLIHEKSPYLLQHAHNPVDWYPWGNEAFSHAAQENKPVFLSIGYSTCHWCHVMAHESFENPGVAALLNREYICIKVDREERPDIDSVYMMVCQQMTGQGGWPLTIVMTPKKEPFFAGTYFPRVSGAGMPGLMDLLERIATLWHERQDELYQSAGDITAWVKSAPSPSSRDPDRVLLDEGFQELSRQFDPENGGFGHAPKFPAPHILIFLLRYWYLTSEPRALAMVEQTLDAIRYGGIWDHVGGGLHRYATDARWLVPHFEKMLYDQALFVLACTEAYEATGKNRYRTMADECIAYVFRDLRDPGGAFYSAEDADSPGGEGAYYTWTCDELAAALGSDDARRATSFFTLTPLPGNSYNHGKSGNNRQEQRLVLSAVAGPDPVCAEDIPGDDRSIIRESIRSRLYAAREKRARPARDDKILTDTNALFCTALARAGRVFRKPAYVEAASEAMQFLSGQLSDCDCGLQHRYREGVSGIPAFADDYAYLISALIALYGATFDPAYLYRALDLNTTFIAHFQDKEKGGFFTTSDQAEELLVRKKEWYDGAVPSANAVAFENLTWLSRVTGDAELGAAASACARFIAGAAARAPSAAAAFLAALACSPGAGDVQDLVIAGDPARADTIALLNTPVSRYLPGLTVLNRPPGTTGDNLDIVAPVTCSRVAPGCRATAYLCSGHTCKRPVTDPKELLILLDEVKGGTGRS